MVQQQIIVTDPSNPASPPGLAPNPCPMSQTIDLTGDKMLPPLIGPVLVHPFSRQRQKRSGTPPDQVRCRDGGFAHKELKNDSLEAKRSNETILDRFQRTEAAAPKTVAFKTPEKQAASVARREEREANIKTDYDDRKAKEIKEIPGVPKLLTDEDLFGEGLGWVLDRCNACGGKCNLDVGRVAYEWVQKTLPKRNGELQEDYDKAVKKANATITRREQKAVDDAEKRLRLEKEAAKEAETETAKCKGRKRKADDEGVAHPAKKSKDDAKKRNQNNKRACALGQC